MYFVPTPVRKYNLFLDKNLIFELEKVFEEEKPSIIHSHFDGYDEYVVKAIKILIEKNLKFVVRITEGVDTRRCIKKYFGEEIPTEIEIIPQTEDIANRFHEADWFISASRRETFSYAIAGTMLSGTPIISSNTQVSNGR